MAPSSTAGAEMRDIVSAAWWDAPGRVWTTESNSADPSRHRASLPWAPSMRSIHLSAALSVRTVNRVP